MRFPLFIAWRYLIGKKSTNAINVITGISILGLCVGTAALIIVLSVFNGFEELLGGLMNAVNADVKVEPREGKTFQLDSSVLAGIQTLEGVNAVSVSLEETALLEYNGKQDFCTLKGVDDNYNRATIIDSMIIQGDFRLHENDFNYVVLGGGIANRLNINMKDVFEPVAVYMLRQSTSIPGQPPFKKQLAYPAGKFAVKQDFDYTYVFSSLDFIQNLLSKPGQVSAIEVDLSDDVASADVIAGIESLVGDSFTVKDRYAQNSALFKLMKIEKWLSYAIIGLILFMVSFNLLIALWMIVLDKKRDLSILQALGATKAQIRNVLRWEGILVSGIGITAGLVIALFFTVLQKKFGIISFPEGFVVDAYPIVLRLTDFAIIAATVLGIGILASVLPARRAGLITPYVREE